MIDPAKRILWAACAVCGLVPAIAGAEGQVPGATPQQQAAMEAQARVGAPGAPHAGLAASAGSYDIMIRSWRSPAEPPTEDAGTATRKMILDGRVLVEMMNATLMGRPYTGHEMSGYDNATGEYWTTWMDNNSTGLMVFRGSCDAAGACSLSGSWQDPATKRSVTARMTTRWTSPGTQLFEMFGPGRDGKEGKALEIVYTKK